jgi:hypothetical protein
MSANRNKRFLSDAGSARAATEIAKSLYKIPTLLTTWTRCGKPHCRCREGQLHGPYHALHWRDGAIQRRRYVRAVDVPAVQAILEKRREQRATERLALALSIRAWHELGAWVAAVEARLREHGEQR